MKRNLAFILPIAALGLLAMPASAQEGPATTDSETFAVIGTVPILCSAGIVTGGDGVFDLGVLIDTTTGLLRDDLSAPDQQLAGAFCSGRSTITVDATPLVAQNYTATPPAGFSRGVDYVATASGWTETPATFDTASQGNAAATQNRDTAFSGDITVGVSEFGTVGGATLLLVADTNYRGTVTVTLAAAE